MSTGYTYKFVNTLEPAIPLEEEFIDTANKILADTLQAMINALEDNKNRERYSVLISKLTAVLADYA